ncbi:acylphosphatase [Corallococcus carmarthensis]|uniref:acylphosphatase n=1 Tax=Corallococcus carmarthensis TaxID=2316728 RepID=A0A3A8K2D3_9BACT|nr:acylphosphatase [Corallococcus carmarthensis]NOK16954.1 acylphosphatase [Corallococcus carmarthensis]RKH02303.1 acylphosphatase [Corallococcus carmarthensis]
MSTQRRVTLRIQGTVQGVSYRESARHEALRLGVSGWVRNRSDGSVEATVEGEPGALDDFIRWCHTGPRMARVTDVARTDGGATGEFRTFTVERTS